MRRRLYIGVNHVREQKRGHVTALRESPLQYGHRESFPRARLADVEETEKLGKIIQGCRDRETK